MVANNAYGSLESGGLPTDASQQSSSARRALVLVGAIAASCLALSGALVMGGTGRTELSFTSHLDLDKGALSALENAASGGRSDFGRKVAFADTRPKMPRIMKAALKARVNNLMAREAGSVGADDSEMLALKGVSSSRDEAKEGMKTTDYEDLTDAAGEE